MANVWIVGAGHMGRSALRFLAHNRSDLTFTVIDRSDESLESSASVDPGRVRTVRQDVATEDVDFSGADIVLNLAGPFFDVSTRVAEGAIAAGVSYIDIADDVEATEAILQLNATARHAQASVVTGAGLSPGVSNWLAEDLLDEHPAADGIAIAWVTHEPDPGGLAPLRHMLHMAVNPAYNVERGRLVETVGFRPETARRYRMPGELGEVEAFDTAHPEPLTLSRAHPELQKVSCQGALEPGWANTAFSTLGRIGFGYPDVRVEMRGVSIEPAEFLWQLMWKRHRSRLRPSSDARTLVHVEASRGDKRLGARTIVDHGVMGVGTGIGAAAAVLSVLESAVPPGAHGPEAIDHRRGLGHFLDLARTVDAFPNGIIRS